MTPDLARARRLVGQATAGRGLDRQAAIEWFELRERATGEEAEQIAYLAEALMVAAAGADRLWLQALLDGGPEEAGRADAADAPAAAEAKPAKVKAKPEEGGGGIDWGKVAREANTMLELNRGATEGWQGQRDHKASK